MNFDEENTGHVLLAHLHGILEIQLKRSISECQLDKWAVKWSTKGIPNWVREETRKEIEAIFQKTPPKNPR